MVKTHTEQDREQISEGFSDLEGVIQAREAKKQADESARFNRELEKEYAAELIESGSVLAGATLVDAVVWYSSRRWGEAPTLSDNALKTRGIVKGEEFLSLGSRMGDSSQECVRALYDLAKANGLTGISRSVDDVSGLYTLSIADTPEARAFLRHYLSEDGTYLTQEAFQEVEQVRAAKAAIKAAPKAGASAASADDALKAMATIENGYIKLGSKFPKGVALEYINSLRDIFGKENGSIRFGSSGSVCFVPDTPEARSLLQRYVLPDGSGLTPEGFEYANRIRAEFGEELLDPHYAKVASVEGYTYSFEDRLPLNGKKKYMRVGAGLKNGAQDVVALYEKAQKLGYECFIVHDANKTPSSYRLIMQDTKEARAFLEKNPALQAVDPAVRITSFQQKPFDPTTRHRVLLNGDANIAEVQAGMKQAGIETTLVEENGRFFVEMENTPYNRQSAELILNSQAYGGVKYNSIGSYTPEEANILQQRARDEGVLCQLKKGKDGKVEVLVEEGDLGNRFVDNNLNKPKKGVRALKAKPKISVGGMMGVNAKGYLKTLKKIAEKNNIQIADEFSTGNSLSSYRLEFPNTKASRDFLEKYLLPDGSGLNPEAVKAAGYKMPHSYDMSRIWENAEGGKLRIGAGMGDNAQKNVYRLQELATQEGIETQRRTTPGKPKHSYRLDFPDTPQARAFLQKYVMPDGAGLNEEAIARAMAAKKPAVARPTETPAPKKGARSTETPAPKKGQPKKAPASKPLSAQGLKKMGAVQMSSETLLVGQKFGPDSMTHVVALEDLARAEGIRAQRIINNVDSTTSFMFTVENTDKGKAFLQKYIKPDGTGLTDEATKQLEHLRTARPSGVRDAGSEPASKKGSSSKGDASPRPVSETPKTPRASGPEPSKPASSSYKRGSIKGATLKWSARGLGVAFNAWAAYNFVSDWQRLKEVKGDLQAAEDGVRVQTDKLSRFDGQVAPRDQKYFTKGEDAEIKFRAMVFYAAMQEGDFMGKTKEEWQEYAVRLSEAKGYVISPAGELKIRKALVALYDRNPGKYQEYLSDKLSETQQATSSRTAEPQSDATRTLNNNSAPRSGGGVPQRRQGRREL